jgi:hypothetical protein
MRTIQVFPCALLLVETCWPAVRDLLVSCAPPDATPREMTLQSAEYYRAATAQRGVVPEAPGLPQWRCSKGDAIIAQ